MGQAVQHDSGEMLRFVGNQTIRLQRVVGEEVGEDEMKGDIHNSNGGANRGPAPRGPNR